MPDKDSPLWPILRIAVVGLVGIVALSVGYKDGWVTRADLPIVLSLLAGVGGVEGVQRMLCGKKCDKPKDEP